MRTPLRPSLMNPRKMGLPAFLKKSGWFLTVLLFLCLTAWAQDQATLVGTATDPTGAAIPGAKVAVSNPDVGFTRDLVTNTAGEYTAARIPIGNYVITVEASGFQKLVRSGIVLQVGQTLRVDLQMTVGQISQEVTVRGSAVKVETENATVSDVVSGNQIQELTLVGRNYQMLAILTPGAAPEDYWDPTKLGHNSQAGISFNGTRDYYNNFEIEGGQNNDTSSGGPSPDTFPALDSIAEFRINTSNYGADIGMRAGANIQVITKSGTKDFHGTADEFVRNDHFDANDWFVNRRRWDGLDVKANCGGNPAGPCNAPKRPLKWNLYGYTLGGPFYIPGHYNTDKSKTFFFWSQSWAKYREGTVISANAPTLRMRQGDFSECHGPGALGPGDPGSPNYNPIAASGCALPINPATGKTFPGDIVPTIDPNAQAIMNSLVPLPNNGIDGYLVAPSTPTDWRQEQIRVDQNISDKTTVFVRFTQDTWTQNLLPALWTGASYDTIASPWGVPAKNAVFHLTHTFKPNLMNEFILAYGNDVHFIRTVAGPGSPNHSILKPSNWSVVPIFAANATQRTLPAVSLGGGTPFSFYEDASTDVNYNSTLPTVSLKDNIVYSLGKHSLKFGVFYLNYEDHGILNYYDPQGSFSFSGGGFPGSTGNGLADMYLGRITQYQEGTPYDYARGVALGGFGEEYARWKQFEPYFQDDWKVNRRLTLNLGVRWTWNQMYHTVNKLPVDTDFLPNQYDINKAAQLDINGNLIPGSGQFYTGVGNGVVICGTGGLPMGCIYPDRATLAPRFGFAIDPTGTGKTAVRGGFGVYHDLNAGLEVSAGQVLGGPPAVLAPVANNILGYQSIVPGPLGTASIGAFPTRATIPMIMQYNVTVQHEFSGNNFLSVGWVASLGRHLGAKRNINQIPVGIGTKNVPVLAGTPGCDASGNCDVQNILINQTRPTIFFAPYRDFATINFLQYSAVSNYNSLQVNFRHAVGHGLIFQSAYTWSHGIDTTTGYLGNHGVDDSNLSRWRATSDANRTHVLVMNYIYDLPLFRHTSSSFLRNGLGGWKFSGITSFYSGVPVDFGCGHSGFSSGIGRGIQCNTLGPLKIKRGVDTTDTQFGPTPTWFDPSVIAQPLFSQLRADGASGMFGYMGRNVLTGPGRNNWDLALLKDFQAPWFNGEHSTFQFRLETFNTFNHPQWNSINAGCGGQTPFGSPCNGNANNYQNGQVSGARAPRLVQLGLKFIF